MHRKTLFTLLLSLSFLQFSPLNGADFKTSFIRSYQDDPQKQKSPLFTRVIRTMTCPDSDYIPKVENAGQITTHKGFPVQIMHNGIMIHLHSYCEGERWDNVWMTDIIQGLRGHHEPQEEKVFYEVLKTVKPGSAMLELGCWWAYYSMWFNKVIPEAKNYLVEPNKENLRLGKANFALNNMEGDFTYSYLGERVDTTIGGIDGDAPMTSVDAFMDEKNIPFLEVLHADIQGGELKMLMGAKQALKEHKIRYIILSTHGAQIGIGAPKLHEQCLAYLEDHDYHIICEHTTSQSCSVDGLIVARARSIEGLDHIDISKYDYKW